jgi:hypothetical protein
MDILYFLSYLLPWAQFTPVMIDWNNPIYLSYNKIIQDQIDKLKAEAWLKYYTCWIWTAQVKLTELVQGSSQASDYIQLFKTIKSDSGFNKAGLIPLFKKGLRANVHFQVSGEWIYYGIAMEHYGTTHSGLIVNLFPWWVVMNTTAWMLAEWKAESIHTDNLIWEVKADKALYHTSTPQAKPMPKPMVNVTVIYFPCIMTCSGDLQV